MFFLGVGKDPFNGLFPPLVEFPVLRSIAGVVGQFLIVLPDMPLYGLYAVFGAGTQMAGRTVDTDLRFAFVLPVSIPVGGAVGQNLILWTEHTVIIFVIYILLPLVAALHGLGTLIGCG